VKRIYAMGIFVVMLLASVGAASATVNLVTNGGFEAPVLPSGQAWNIFDNGVVPGWSVAWTTADPVSWNGHSRPVVAKMELQHTGLVEGILSAEGNQHAELDTDWFGPAGGILGSPSDVTISQTINTIPGAHYTVSYEEHCRPSDTHNPCTLQFDWSGFSPSPNTPGPTHAADPWTTYTYDRVATGTSTTIAFTDTGVPDSIGALIDNVIVTQTSSPPAIPEFPTIALPVALIVGMLGAVLFIKSTKEN
jgi:hypothetical protein